MKLYKTINGSGLEVKELNVSEANSMIQDLCQSFELHAESSTNFLYYDAEQNVVELKFAD